MFVSLFFYWFFVDVCEGDLSLIYFSLPYCSILYRRHKKCPERLTLYHIVSFTSEKIENVYKRISDKDIHIFHVNMYEVCCFYTLHRVVRCSQTSCVNVDGLYYHVLQHFPLVHLFLPCPCPEMEKRNRSFGYSHFPLNTGATDPYFFKEID